MRIIYLLSELIPCLLIGYLLGKSKQNFSLFFARTLIKFGIPISLTGLLLKTGLNLQLIEAALMALLAIGLLMILLNIIPNISPHINNRALLLGAVFGNTGYYGIPVSLALLPNEALIYSMGFDLGATLVIWSLGELMLRERVNKSQGIKHCISFMKALANSPAIKGLIAALIIQQTPWNEQLSSYLWIPTRIVIIAAIIVVGMRLSVLNTSKSFKFKAQIISIKDNLIYKLIALPTLMLSLCLIFKLSNVMRNALVLQAAAPTAISVLLIAQANSKDEDKSTLLVVISTLISLFTIPLWSLTLGL